MGTGSLLAAFDRSLKDPAGFWGEAAEAVHWYKKWDKVLDDSRQPFYRWFVGGEVNTCYNALDLHIEEGRGDQPALIYDSPVTSASKTFTYRELRDRVAGFAGALARLGVGKGDRVIIYMPMVPEAAVAMLACVVVSEEPSSPDWTTNAPRAATTASRKTGSPNFWRSTSIES